MTFRGTRLAGLCAAVAAPVALTALLNTLSTSLSRDYVFLYLGIVATLGLTSGIAAASLSAAVSFLLVDWFFVQPLHTLTIADETDLVNLAVFTLTAVVVGGLGSQRRRAQTNAEALADGLRRANVELTRLNREQAEAAVVAVRLAQTEQQVATLEQTDRLRRELIGNVSHELRTPLGTILTGTTAVAERDDVPASAKDELGVVIKQTQRLSRMVADLLDLSRIDAHALDLHLADVDLGDAISAAVDRLHVSDPARSVMVDLPEGGLEILADWDRLGQILDNLLGNAERHAPPGSAITVRATVGRRDVAVVGVIDHGPGIAAGLRDHVFERFAHGPAGSTGLGLSIVKGLVEAHAGRVWLEESPPDGGTHVAFTLPLAHAASGDSSAGDLAGEDVHIDVGEKADEPS